MNRALCIIGFLAFAALQANATTLAFENFAPESGDGLVLITPNFPYTESGFTLTPSSAIQAFVFDSAWAPFHMYGDNTDWFCFSPNNIISLTAPGPFSLESLLIGPNTFGASPVTMTITGNFFGGGTTTAVFSGVTTATTATLNWVNLSSVSFSANVYAGMDDLVVTVPEPSSLALFGMVSALVAARRYSRNKSDCVV